MPIKIQRSDRHPGRGPQGYARLKDRETLLEAVADYASLSGQCPAVRALNETTQSPVNWERQNDVWESVRAAIMEDLKSATYPIDLLLRK